MKYGFELLVDGDTGDLDIKDNDFHFTESTSESLRQRVELRLNTNKGEWDYNTEFGLPSDKIKSLSGITEKAQIEAEFIKQINLEPDVTNIKSFDTVYNEKTRSLTVSRLDVYNNNELYSLDLVNPNAVVYSYPIPTPLGDIIICDDEEDLVEVATDLHLLLNEEMVYTGDKTWWNLWVGESVGRALVDLDPTIHSHYTLSTPFVANGDFELGITFTTSGKDQQMIYSGGVELGGFDLYLRGDGVGFVIMHNGVQIFLHPYKPLADGKEHTVTVKRTGTLITSSVDGIPITNKDSIILEGFIVIKYIGSSSDGSMNNLLTE